MTKQAQNPNSSITELQLLRKKLYDLFSIIFEIETIGIPSELLRSAQWDYIARHINAMHEFEIMAKTLSTDGTIPELHEVEIIFEADNSKPIDEERLLTNLNKEYSNFYENPEKEEYLNLGERIQYHFHGIWTGETESCIKLTEQAEKLFCGTGFQNIHIEVKIDGKWYGKKSPIQENHTDYNPDMDIDEDYFIK